MKENELKIYRTSFVYTANITECNNPVVIYIFNAIYILPALKHIRRFHLENGYQYPDPCQKVLTTQTVT